MALLSYFHPMGRTRRPGFLVALLLCLAAGSAGLNALRFGGPYSLAGLALFLLALWVLFSIMVNRIRDANASAAWLLGPVLVTVVSMYIAVSMGYIDFSNIILPHATREDRIVMAPFRPFVMLISAFLPMMIAAVVSALFWITSFIMLAALPSRPARR